MDSPSCDPLLYPSIVYGVIQVEAFVLQIKTLLISTLGIIAFVPGPNREGELRIKGPLNNLISYAGIVIFIAPWIVIPFLSQPRFVGLANTIMQVSGTLLILLGVGLYVLALKVLLPAFRGQFSEFTPELLVTSGPYQFVRHPIYLAALIIFLGLYIQRCASLSILFLPFCYLIFRLVAAYEEIWILEPKFSDHYRDYKAEVPSAIIGKVGGVLFAIVYLALMGLSLTDLLQVSDLAIIQ